MSQWEEDCGSPEVVDGLAGPELLRVEATMFERRGMKSEAARLRVVASELEEACRGSQGRNVTPLRRAEGGAEGA